MAFLSKITNKYQISNLFQSKSKSKTESTVEKYKWAEDKYEERSCFEPKKAMWNEGISSKCLYICFL